MFEPQFRMIINDVMRVYMPREDITVYELAKLHQLITITALSPMKSVFRDAYVEKYGLLRHFEIAST